MTNNDVAYAEHTDKLNHAALKLKRHNNEVHMLLHIFALCCCFFCLFRILKPKEL